MTDLRQLILRGVVKSTTPTSGIQEVTAETLADDVDGMEHFQPYGLSAAVPAGAEIVAVKIGGADDHMVAVVADDRASRPTDLLDGEVCLYSKHGQRITLLTDGSIVLEPKAGLTVKIGGTATDYIVMAQALHTWLDALNTAWTPVANDGGAALKTALTSALLSFVNAVKATKGQVE